MNLDKKAHLIFSGFFAFLLYLLIDAYNQYLTTVDKISFFVSGICLLALSIHQLYILWSTNRVRDR